MNSQPDWYKTEQCPNNQEIATVAIDKKKISTDVQGLICPKEFPTDMGLSVDNGSGLDKFQLG